MNLSWILGVGSFFFQVVVPGCALKKRRKMFARPCFSEDEPNLACSQPEDACDEETSDFKLARLEATRVSLLIRKKAVYTNDVGLIIDLAEHDKRLRNTSFALTEIFS